MLNLMKLELQKYKLKGTILGGVIAILIFMGSLIAINYDEPLKSYKEAYLLTNSASFIFIIFASVLLSQFIINEYKNKTVTVLFMYPLSRKKLLTAKMSIVVLFTFVFSLLSRVVIFTGFYIFNQFAQIVDEELTNSMLVNYGAGFLSGAVMTSCISLVPLYFGMRKYSASATIVSAVILMAVLNIGSGTEFTLNSIVYIPAALAVTGVLVALLTLRNVEGKDVL
ncbi:ABC transporter permease [Paenibacillus sp. Marseille-P2973]|uniref:ABC transporter permease n=1 Tax=Paenibacillus sp. Marseille-P2973 TaxID=1871032 RepID=UPI001B3742DB|nr:ABC transporter permease [Paenibacillus sp. Marseille-P2973]MBQ4899738.1 ABC transporter permease [Paenibacillus sp. Marseille-P2973]